MGRALNNRDACKTLWRLVAVWTMPALLLWPAPIDAQGTGERFAVACEGKWRSGQPTRPAFVEKDFTGTLSIDLKAMKWAWTHKPGKKKVKPVARVEDDKIVLEDFYSERNRWSLVQHLTLKPLSFFAWHQGHTRSAFVNAECRKVAFKPFE